MNLAVLNPAGEIAMQEKNLMITALALMLIVVIPVIIMLFVFAWKYRASNTKAKYLPNWCHNNWLELAWWLIPSAIIAVLATITWITTHKLDPYRKLEHSAKPVEIQVVALDWKWLFFYPEYNIATVNYIKIPENRPINFLITADAPMNSFAIPKLGGQIYAMQGMKTKIHLIANQTGTFEGYSANYSGHGFSGMNFKVVAETEEDFAAWVKDVKEENVHLSKRYYYDHLLAPTKNHPIEYYSTVEENLFNHIVEKYLMSHSGHNAHQMHHDTAHGSKNGYTVEEHKKDVAEVAKHYQELAKNKHH